MGILNDTTTISGGGWDMQAGERVQADVAELVTAAPLLSPVAEPYIGLQLSRCDKPALTELQIVRFKVRYDADRTPIDAELRLRPLTFAEAERCKTFGIGVGVEAFGDTGNNMGAGILLGTATKLAQLCYALGYTPLGKPQPGANKAGDPWGEGFSPATLFGAHPPSRENDNLQTLVVGALTAFQKAEECKAKGEPLPPDGLPYGLIEALDRCVSLDSGTRGN
jgi:hypothetical protein